MGRYPETPRPPSTRQVFPVTLRKPLAENDGSHVPNPRDRCNVASSGLPFSCAVGLRRRSERSTRGAGTIASGAGTREARRALLSPSGQCSAMTTGPLSWPPLARPSWERARAGSPQGVGWATSVAPPRPVTGPPVVSSGPHRLARRDVRPGMGPAGASREDGRAQRPRTSTATSSSDRPWTALPGPP